MLQHVYGGGRESVTTSQRTAVELLALECEV